jgi:hypothetical protein
MARPETILHLFGSASTELLLDDILDANRIPPNCPTPSFRIQLSVADIGAAACCPTPMAKSRDWVDKTIVAVEAVFAINEYVAYFL